MFVPILPSGEVLFFGSPVDFKGNLSLLDIFFSRGLKQMEE